ncbi:hypothetical protein STANM309S_01681 [Streptomyces tanashiensis]
MRDLGGTPVAAEAAYELPFRVADPAGAVRLAAVLEERVAGVYSDLVRATEGRTRARRPPRSGRRRYAPSAGAAAT